MTIFNNTSTSINNLLYTVNPNDLEQFKLISSHYLYLLDETNLDSKCNIFLTLCDIWLAIKPYNEAIILDPHECMNHPSAALQLKLIEENTTIQNYIKMEKLNYEQQFILSYFISHETMNWLQIIMNADGRQQLLDRYTNVESFAHFLHSDDDNLIEEMNHQTIFVKAIMQNVRETNDFHFAVSTAISKTKNYIRSII